MINKKLSTLALTGMMIMSMGTSVFAANTKAVADNGTKDNPATASITKDLEFAEGITVPTATFSFNAVKVTADTPDAPDATIKDISYSDKDAKGDLNNGKYVIGKNSKIEFGTFPHAGEFKYTVSETKGDVEGMTYSTKTYTLKVFVANDDNGGLYVKTITATDDETGQKPDQIVFTNTYVKNGGQESNTDSLVIKKETKGAMADKTKDFEFKLSFVKAATTPDADKKLTGKIGTETVEFEYGVEKTFKLHDGEELIFDKIPAGTRYEVTEVGVEDGYTPSVDVIENGTALQQRTVADADDLCSAEAGKNNLIGENENKVTFVNTYKDVPVTGIIAKNMPFILMTAFGALAAAGYVLTKRRFVKR